MKIKRILIALLTALALLLSSCGNATDTPGGSGGIGSGEGGSGSGDGGGSHLGADILYVFGDGHRKNLLSVASGM